MVLAGEKLKESKKKAKMASASSSSQRDWGKVRFKIGQNRKHRCGIGSDEVFMSLVSRLAGYGVCRPH